jgi:hypothetical protein
MSYEAKRNGKEDWIEEEQQPWVEITLSCSHLDINVPEEPLGPRRDSDDPLAAVTSARLRSCRVICCRVHGLVRAIAAACGINIGDIFCV